jgi:Flp pilus assembly protein TadB
MAHLAGRCDCGRKIHLPKHAKRGYRWTCHSCGKTWTLSNRGKPLHSERSKHPRAPQRRPTRSQSELLGKAIGVLIFGWIIYALFGEIGVIVVLVILGLGFYQMFIKR